MVKASDLSEERQQVVAEWGIARFLAAPFSGEAELAATRAFIRAEDGDGPSYLWWQGPPGAGKTALLSRAAVGQPPENVDVVAFFLSAAEGRDSAGDFVREMNRQLTRHLGGRAPDTPGGISPRALQVLYRQAAARSAAAGRTLLIVVDGLEEDAAWREGVPDGERPRHSIAALLPHVPKGAAADRSAGAIRVLVAGRSAARPPADVPRPHPLRRPGAVRLLNTRESEAGAVHAVREAWARRDMSPAEEKLLGLIAAAGPGLRAEDLAEAAGTGLGVVERLLREAGDRYPVPDGSGAWPGGPGAEAAVRVARERTGAGTLALSTGLLHTWADFWQGERWPENTPPYLLGPYPRLLSGTDRLAPYVLDRHRQLRMVARGRVGEALAQLGLVAEGGGGDLGVSYQVALSRALLSSRARRVPREFVGLFASAGEASRARELALSAPDPVDRAVLLTDAALALGDAAEAGRPAGEAAEWAGEALRTAPLGAERDTRLEAVARGGYAFRGRGLREAGNAVLRAVVVCEAMAWRSRIRAARELGAEYADLLSGLPSYAAELAARGPEEQAAALEIWTEVARGARDEAAIAARDGVEEFCDGLEPQTDLVQIGLLALGACAVLPNRRRRGRELARAAHRALLAAFQNPGALPDAARAQLALELGPVLTYVVQAMHGAGLSSDVRHLLEAVPATARRDLFDEDAVAEARRASDTALAAEGKGKGKGKGRKKAPDDTDPPPEYLTPNERDSLREELAKRPEVGHRLLSHAFARWSGQEPVADAATWGPALVGALAATGHAGVAVKLAGRARGPAGAASGPAVVAMHCAVGGHRADAGRYAREAAEWAGAAPDAAACGLLAQAFAYAGEEAAARTWMEGMARAPRDRNAQAWAAVAVGLARYAPEAAEALAGERPAPARPNLPAMPGVPRMRDAALRRVAALLPALSDPRDPDTPVHATLREVCGDATKNLQDRDPHTALLLSLLHETGCCPGLVPQSQIHVYERHLASTRLASGRPVAEWAVLQAVRGDVGAARETAGLAGTPDERAAALAAVATHLAGVPVIAPLAEGWSPQRIPVLRYLAIAGAVGPESSRDEAEARRLAQELLAGPHWRYALPLLPRLAPESAAPLAELALAHTGP
ncbi:hypothetical protein ACGH2B_08720 [Streptomyces sp. BBFR2]|uniref:hypothetical protein n=1 Tax=Streptomyces sp. BBFR2 TaxID=3372854 RepID=UPI0037D99A07